ncbi:MAG: hypothetical protein L6U16_04815 [Porphyromonadaceae bacterium]|nr:MAG: hypothetical protein L6U16_04815 [Porphyromonadaceae bacterium]
MKLVIVVIALVGIAVMLLGVKIFFVKGGKFPNTHIHSNKHMKKSVASLAHTTRNFINNYTYKEK